MPKALKNQKQMCTFNVFVDQNKIVTYPKKLFSYRNPIDSCLIVRNWNSRKRLTLVYSIYKQLLDQQPAHSYHQDFPGVKTMMLAIQAVQNFGRVAYLYKFRLCKILAEWLTYRSLGCAKFWQSGLPIQVQAKYILAYI